MGGPAAEHNDFWQLFVRPAATGRWRLATPPGVASNGGLVVASLGAGSVVAGFRPSQDLSYSPLATTHDNGTAWTPGLLDAALADVPDALAAAPGGGHLLALLASGQAELSGPSGTGWTKLATRQTLAASPAGRSCGLGSLTAAAFSPSGVPMLAASCTHPGTAGVFAYASGTWHPAGPTLPATYARQDISVLWLTTTAGTTMALLAAGTGSAARPARRLVHRRRCPLGPVAAAAAARRQTHIRLVRARRHRGGGADREPRAGHRRPGRLMAAAARPATRHGNARPRP